MLSIQIIGYHLLTDHFRHPNASISFHGPINLSSSLLTDGLHGSRSLLASDWSSLSNPPSDWLTRLTPQHQLDTSAEMTDELGASGSAWLITTNVCFIMFYPHTAALKIFYGARFIVNLANIFERIEHIL